MYWPLILVAVVIIVCIISREGFGDTTPLIFSGWRYDNRMNPVDNEVARIASGVIDCTKSRRGGTGSRDFSRGGVWLPYAEPMCGGHDSLCRCSGNETR